MNAELLERVCELRETADNQEILDLMKEVREVVIILTSSRSGSSLVAKVLGKLECIISMAGEINPFIILVNNGNNEINNECYSKEFLKKLLLEFYPELGVNSTELSSNERIKELWIRRFLIQFPEMFSKRENYNKMLEALNKALKQIGEKNIKDETKIHKIILRSVFSENQELLRFYDIFSDEEIGGAEIPESFIEEPKFICPNLYTRPLKKEDLEGKILLFKSPEDINRIEMYYKLFPNAKIKIFYLTRNFASTVNGLISGWLSPKGFFAHNIKNKFGKELSIEGYSDLLLFGKKWWKFDLPENWRDFINKPLLEVCLNQWISSHKKILNFIENLEDKQNKVYRLHFEDFIENPKGKINEILRFLGHTELNSDHEIKLPRVMITEEPEPARWKLKPEIKKKLLEFAEREEVRRLMLKLGYSMNPVKWV